MQRFVTRKAGIEPAPIIRQIMILPLNYFLLFTQFKFLVFFFRIE